MPSQYPQSSTTPGVQSGTTSADGVSGDTRESARQEARQTTDKARETAQQAREKARAASERFKHEAREIKDEVRNQSQQFANEMRQQTEAVVQERKARAADEISTIGHAVHRAADQLRQEQDEQLASYVDAAGEQVDRIADYARNRSLSEMAEDARAIAREHPQVFYGALIVAGIAAARFIKASSPERRAPRGQFQSGYDSGFEAFDDEFYDSGASYETASSTSSYPTQSGPVGSTIPGTAGMSSPPGVQEIGADEAYNPARGSAPLGPDGAPLDEPGQTQMSGDKDTSSPRHQSKEARGYGHTPGFEPESSSDKDESQRDPNKRF